MTRHLGARLSDYVDRRLDAATLAELDRHVVACQVCRASADQERQLLAALRASPGPAVSTSLQELLLGLATGATGRPDRAAMVPEVPRAPQSLPGLRLPVVAPAAPALH
ncbi:MAG: zf-HC2 domain-containing protein, partial [Dermatophilaceae bacterium]